MLHEYIQHDGFWSFTAWSAKGYLNHKNVAQGRGENCGFADGGFGGGV
jgi:hypothetical protein